MRIQGSAFLFAIMTMLAAGTAKSADGDLVPLPLPPASASAANNDLPPMPVAPADTSAATTVSSDSNTSAETSKDTSSTVDTTPAEKLPPGAVLIEKPSAPSGASEPLPSSDNNPAFKTDKPVVLPPQVEKMLPHDSKGNVKIPTLPKSEDNQEIPPLPPASPTSSSAEPEIPPLTPPPLDTVVAEPASKAPADKAKAVKTDAKKVEKEAKETDEEKEQVSQVNLPLPSAYVIKDKLPPEIYKKAYDKNNRHLPIARYGSDYEKLLFVAAKKDDINGIRSLIKEGVDVNASNAAGDTPLLIAVKNNAIHAALLLIRHKADTSILDGKGMTPLQIAEKSGNHRMADLLSSIPE